MFVVLIKSDIIANYVFQAKVQQAFRLVLQSEKRKDKILESFL